MINRPQLPSFLFLLLFLFLTMGSALVGCSPPGKDTVSYSTDVTPILKSRCFECHTKSGEGYKVSGLSMESYAELMKGTKFGPVIKPNDSLSSTLMILVEGRADPSIRMPHGDREPLTEAQIQVIGNWIDQGAKNN